MIDTYTKLLETAAELSDKKTADEAVTKLIRHLKSAGRMKMLPQIARELKKVAARRAAHKPVLEIAHEKERVHALKEAESAGVTAPRVSVNQSLIRGWRLREAGRLIDHSGKAALVDIYKKIAS